MKINFPLMNQPIEISKATIFSIEDPAIFSKVAQSIYEFDEDAYVRLYNSKNQPIRRDELYIVTDIYNYNVNTNPLKKALQKEINDNLNLDIHSKVKIESILNELNRLLYEEIIELELDTSFEELNLINVLKGLKLEAEMSHESIFEKILDIVLVYKYIGDMKLLVFINCLSYLTSDQIHELINFISLLQVECLILEPRIVEGFKQHVLDSDYFLYLENGII